MIPTKRTIRKFGRDLIIAVGVAVVAFVSDHAADLNLSPETTAILVAFAAVGWRVVRSYMGQEPQSG